MANANSPRGLVPYRRYDGQAWSGGANIYYVSGAYASNIFVGDPVITVDSQNDANGVPAVQLATAGGSSTPILGAMIGIVAGGDPQVAITRDMPLYRPASTAMYILVADDPALLYMVQEDSVGGSIAATGSSKNASLVSGAGSTVTGYSGWQLQSSTAATTNTLQMRILRPLPETDNALGTNAKWLVKPNFPQHLLALGT